MTLQALSLVEKAEPVQARFTLRSRNQRRVCECKMDVRSTWIPTCHQHGPCFMVTWIIFKKSFLGGRSNTKPGDHDTPNVPNCWFILFFHVWEPAWMESHWNSIWSRAWSHMASHYTWGSVTWVHDFEGVPGRPLDAFFWALTVPWSRLLACEFVVKLLRWKHQCLFSFYFSLKSKQLIE